MSSEQDKIPTSKVKRASRFLKTGAKIGGNYVAHYSKKAIGKAKDRSELDKKNAGELMKVLKELKGSGLKIAQMMSMDNGLLPKEYVEEFKTAQVNSMALSGPLVINTFRKYLGKSPKDIFEKFNPVSVHAASIGQVHEAYYNGERLAVKIQYPGVADSIKSDISMVKPLVLRIFGISEAAVEEYLKEIEGKLVEETDYTIELANGIELANNCKHLTNMVFPKYWPELSSKRIITMDWIDGIPLQEFIHSDVNQDTKNKVGQALLDFVYYQVHTLKKFHADFHPGNFLVTNDHKVVVLDFGCVKELPIDFYNNYFSLLKPELVNNDQQFRQVLLAMDFLRERDDEEEDRFFYNTVKEIIQLIGEPMRNDRFDFGDDTYFDKLNAYSQKMQKDKRLRQENAIRGPKHAIYLHRTYFGLYSILNQLKAKVNIDRTFIDKLESISQNQTLTPEH